MKIEIKIDLYFEEGGEVELESIGSPIAQPLYAFVKYSVVSYILHYSLPKAMARVVNLGETHCHKTLLQNIDDGLTREDQRLERKEESIRRMRIL